MKKTYDINVQYCTRIDIVLIFVVIAKNIMQIIGISKDRHTVALLGAWSTINHVEWYPTSDISAMLQLRHLCTHYIDDPLPHARL